MDRENLFARGWSHVLSTGNSIPELESFRAAVGAPLRALQTRPGKRPHLDLAGEPRERALRMPGVMVFDRTADLLRFVRAESSRPASAPPHPSGR